MGKFIVLEGITSTGKTTLGKMLVERMKTKGIEAIFNHEPTDHTPFGRLIRCLSEKFECLPEDFSNASRLSFSRQLSPLAEIIKNIEKGKKLTELERQMVYIADRNQDLREIIAPALLRGDTCVQDRYELSTYAFAATQSIPFDQLKKLHNEMLHEVYIVPDILIYFDLDPEISVDRLKASGKPVDIYETLPKIKKTRTAYEQLLKNKELYRKLYVVDARPPIEKVFRNICRVVETRLVA